MDVQPSNIFLARQSHSGGEDLEVVKVLDFGMSKDLGTQNIRRTAPGTIVGTMEYVSPEGTTGDTGLVDFRSDQWALAVVTYRMLSGRLPFEGKGIVAILKAIQNDQPIPLRTHAPDVPDHVVAAIERAMAKKKEDRFESVPDFVRALNGLPPLSQSIRGSPGGQRFARLGAVKVLSMTRTEDSGPAPAAPHPAVQAPAAAAAAGAGAAPAAASAPVSQHDGDEYSVHVTTDSLAPAPALPRRERRLVGVLATVITGLLATLGFLLVKASQRWDSRPLPPLPSVVTPAPEHVVAPSPPVAQQGPSPLTVPQSAGAELGVSGQDAGAVADGASGPADLGSGLPAG